MSSRLNHAYDINEIVKDIRDEMLKCCGCVGETEGHDRVFEKTKVGAEGRFPFVAFANA